MIELQPIPLLLLLVLTLLAAVLYLLFRGVRRYVLPLMDGRRRQQRWQVGLLRAEVTGWSLWAIFAVYRLLLAAPVTTTLLLLILLLPGRYWWRDFFPGLFFRLDKEAEAGDLLSYQGRTYQIEAIRSRSLRLVDNEGSVLILPYRLLGEVALTKAAESAVLTPFVFSVEAAIPEDQIERYLNECPWVAPGQASRIRQLGEGRYEVTTFAPDEQIGERQERYLLDRLRREGLGKE
jgi:hypothetical protein